MWKDVRFNQVTLESEKAGNIHPTRLNNRDQVGSLQSLAGARPKDDVIVKLLSSQVVGTSLKVSQEPIQLRGILYALVKVIKRISPRKDEFLVDHFNPISQQFDGKSEVIIIPKYLRTAMAFIGLPIKKLNRRI